MKNFRFHIFYALLKGITIALLFPSLSFAIGNVNISPTSVRLSADKPIASISIKNDSEIPIILQTEMMRWITNGDKDVYTPTKDIVVTPPIAQIPPGLTQTLRVGLLRQADPETEVKYRLYITQLPSSDNALENQEGGINLQFVLRMGVPIRVSPLLTKN